MCIEFMVRRLKEQYVKHKDQGRLIRMQLTALTAVHDMQIDCATCTQLEALSKATGCGNVANLTQSPDNRSRSVSQ